MAQKRTNYSKFTGSNGTIQILMLWASLALHLLISSNLGLFGRLDPIKVKPAGGTVRVVDLTPAEQTRVPEAAKSKPLPIAQTPVNPEIATRIPGSPSPPRNPGASNFVPPRNQPQLPPPSSQVPPPTIRQPSPPLPIPSTSKTSGKSDIPIVPKPPRSSQQDNEGTTTGSNQNNSTIQGKPRKKGTQNSQTDSSSEEIFSTNPVGSPSKKPGKKNPNLDPPELPVDPLFKLQQQLNQDIQNLKNSVGGSSNTIEKEISPTLNLAYSSITAVRSIKKCKLDQSGYVLFAIMRTKDGQLIPGKPQISSFLEEEGKILYSNVIDKAFKTIEASPVDSEKNIIYKFNFEFSPNTCGK